MFGIKDQIKRNSMMPIQENSQEQEIQVPTITKNLSELKNKVKCCENHPSKQATYVNTTFLKKFPEKFPKTIFLCQICLMRLRLQFKDEPQFLRNLIKIQAFKERYIDSLMKKDQQKNFNQKQKDIALLSKYENEFINQLEDKKQNIIKYITSSIQQFKSYIKSLFTTLKTPSNPQKVQSFEKKQYSQDLIKHFYSNYHIIQNTKCFIVQNKQENLSHLLQGIKQSFKIFEPKIKKELVDIKEAFVSFIKNQSNKLSIDNSKSKQFVKSISQQIQMKKKHSSSSQSEKRQNILNGRPQDKRNNEEVRKNILNLIQKPKVIQKQVPKQPIKSDQRKRQEISKPKVQQSRERSRENNKNQRNQVLAKDKIEIRIQKLSERPAKIQDIQVIKQSVIPSSIQGKPSRIQIQYIFARGNSSLPRQVRYLAKSQFLNRYPQAYTKFRQQQTIRKN